MYKVHLLIDSALLLTRFPTKMLLILLPLISLILPCYPLPRTEDLHILPMTPPPLPPPPTPTLASLSPTNPVHGSLAGDSSPPTTAKPAPTPEPEVECYHRTREACPKSQSGGRCRYDEGKTRVVCCDVGREDVLEEFAKRGIGGNNKTVQFLHIINATLPELDKSVLRKFSWLKSLAITDGYIPYIKDEFMKGSKINCLNFSNNGIEKIEKRLLTYIRPLRKLDLSFNNLVELPNLNQDRNITIDISNNNKTSCPSLMNIKNSSTILEFVNVNHTFCSFSKSFQWFNSTELMPFSQIDEYFITNENCWPNCSCTYARTDYVEGKTPTIAFSVDCAGKQLTEMPGELPKNTVVLNISNNNISVLKMDKEYFENVREIYADNNKIESILSLEGTKFLDNFVKLSLKNNSLKSLELYMLSYIFDRNMNTKKVYLGNNKLRCDCNTAKNLKVSLLNKYKYIPDYEQIYCDNMERVIDLNPAMMCQDNHQSLTDYIYYIITVEVLLLLCLVMKVSYDYWVFKTAGYLPWPANKMPKLPCDWLCE